MGKLRLWFLLEDGVGRRAYLQAGLSLMLLKYLGEAAFVYAVTGTLWTPLQFVHPLFRERMEVFGRPDWPVWCMALWSLPFLWVGVSMTVRRAVDAGASPWLAMLFFVPGVNYVLMLTLASRPSHATSAWRTEDARDPRQAEAEPASALPRVFTAVGLSTLAALATCSLSVFVARQYGSALFVGAPFLLGAVGAFVLNRPDTRTLGQTLLVALLSVATTCGALLLLALEGVFCLGMALPLAVLLALPGAVLGRSIALHAQSSAAHACLALLVLPLLSGVEKQAGTALSAEVVSHVVIDAPPEEVWEHVIRFSDLPPPSGLVFALGIAYPVRARIEGAGVGAIRYCEFSTGPFVEPITAWEPPRRLAFDVSDQPAPMTEWSPYATVHAPHLDDFLRSRRGEFRLIDLGDGRTRLEGSTWYELEMSPGLYWKLYADAFIGSIHTRVLEHIQRESEAAGATARRDRQR